MAAKARISNACKNAQSHERVHDFMRRISTQFYERRERQNGWLNERAIIETYANAVRTDTEKKYRHRYGRKLNKTQTVTAVPQGQPRVIANFAFHEYFPPNICDHGNCYTSNRGYNLDYYESFRVGLVRRSILFRIIGILI